MQQQDGSLSSAVSFCPSFSIYSTDKLADIADKLVSTQEEENEEEVISNDEDYDFGFVSIDSDFDSRRFLANGEIGRVFPVFNRRLLFNGDYDYSTDRENGNEERQVAALKKLFIDDDRDGDEGRQASSSTSSEEDEPEREPNATFFCIWSSPKRNPTESPSPPPPSICKKSNSTGSSSKKWFKFRDLLKRSHSDGKDSFLFFNKKPTSDSKDKKVKSDRAVEAFYVRNRASKEGDRKKSYLPYKQIFAWA